MLFSIVVSMSVFSPWYHWSEIAGSHIVGPVEDQLGTEPGISWDGTRGDFRGMYTLVLGLVACAASGVVCLGGRRPRSSRDRILALASLLSLAFALLL